MTTPWPTWPTAAVEILAWRPGGTRGVRYRVRATDNSAEGWVAVQSLRSGDASVAALDDTASPATASTSRQPVEIDTHPRFGQRS